MIKSLLRKIRYKTLEKRNQETQLICGRLNGEFFDHTNVDEVMKKYNAWVEYMKVDAYRFDKFSNFNSQVISGICVIYDK